MILFIRKIKNKRGDNMKEVEAVSLGAVHTHTHTHTQVTLQK